MLAALEEVNFFSTQGNDINFVVPFQLNAPTSPSSSIVKINTGTNIVSSSYSAFFIVKWFLMWNEVQLSCRSSLTCIAEWDNLKNITSA